MNIVFWGKGERARLCLWHLLEHGRTIVAVIGQPSANGKSDSVRELALARDLDFHAPEDPNEATFLDYLRSLKADLFILGGYGKIVRKELIGIPPQGCLNLHGGQLPQYRGSSPMNWALINGETSFGVSVIFVDTGVDTGDVCAERTFPIKPTDTIANLHAKANEAFPELLLETLDKLEQGTLVPRKQNEAQAAYYPLRFPDDGLILWDQMNAEEIANLVRALAPPYPCAFTHWKGQKLLITATSATASPFYGIQGRVYQKSRSKGLLVCARDKALWVQGHFENPEQSLHEAIARYATLPTLREMLLQWSTRA